ncbi:3-deoxy-manno-octulosonate cytidylyltransferase [Deltaproteobacteria bacterium TL4]
MSHVIGIIPARMGSSRFPGKPLAKIHNIPMIGHVYYRCKMSPLLQDVYVATCDQAIYEYVESIGGKAVMTRDTHERCTDRTVEAVLKIEKETGQRTDIVVMIQGDEPMITPQMLNEATQPLLNDASILVLNLMSPLKTREEHEDPNQVKVVVDLQGNALYFSREPIPSRKKGAAQVPMLKQVCVIPFRRDFLLKYHELKPTPLEIVESVDMMRVLEHGFDVRMIMTNAESYAVDTPEDLRRVESLMKNDLLRSHYTKSGPAS